jgi:hypothetical protein
MGYIFKYAFRFFEPFRPILALKVHKIEIFFGFSFEVCIWSLLVMSKY